MIRPALALIAILSAGPVLASPLVGMWACKTNGTADPTMAGTMQFGPDGRAHYWMDASGTFPDGSIVELSIETQLDWRLEDGFLYETNFQIPTLARLVIDGQDLTLSQEADDLAKQLEQDSEDFTPSTVSFFSDTTMRIVDGGIEIDCVKQGIAPTS